MSNLPAISLKQAIESLKAQHPEEISVIEAAVRKDVVALGTDEVFAIRGKHGEIRAFKDILTLSRDNGGLTQPVPNGPWTVSAQGYEMWAEKTGASVILTDEIQVDGQWHPNPCPIRDTNNGRLLGYQVRARAFRFSDKGVPNLVEWSTFYDVPTYRLIDLIAKAKDFPQAFRLLPIDLGKPTDEGTWASYPFDESTFLVVNTAHKEALNWYKTILNREKKALDFAQTFARRNALKHLSGLQKAPGHQWTMPVLCWRPVGSDWNVAAEYLSPQNRNARLIGITQVSGEPTGSPVIASGTERVSDEEGYETVVELQTDPEDQEGVIDVQPEVQERPIEVDHSESPKSPPTPNLSDEDRKIMANYATTREMFPGEFDAACQSLQLSPNAEHTIPQAVAIIGAINRMLDA